MQKKSPKAKYCDILNLYKKFKIFPNMNAIVIHKESQEAMQYLGWAFV